MKTEIYNKKGENINPTNNKPIIYIDMDGVLVDYNISNKNEPQEGKFLRMLPLNDSVKAFKTLVESGKYDVYILSTAPYSNPHAWMEKRQWVEKYLGDCAFKRIILSHNKSLLRGEYIIDDRVANGVSEFNGEHIHFGNDIYPNWSTVLKKLKVKY